MAMPHGQQGSAPHQRHSCSNAPRVEPTYRPKHIDSMIDRVMTLSAKGRTLRRHLASSSSRRVTLAVEITVGACAHIEELLEAVRVFLRPMGKTHE